MPKNSSSARRTAARALAATENITYSAALWRLDAQRAPFTDDDFRIGGRTEHYPSSRYLWCARCGGRVELRTGPQEGPTTDAATALRFTADQFDRYQLGAPRATPETSR